jgi:hypothetical protein
VILQAETPLAIAPLLPVWVVAVLIWLNGSFLTAIVALVWRSLNARTTDGAITGAKTSVLDVISTHDRRYAQIELGQNTRLDVLERETFGLDGENGIRGNVKITRREVSAMMIVLRRMAESEDVDTKEIDALNGE